MKNYIVKALKWALSKFEDKPVEVWPFPAPVKKTVKKATTRPVKKTVKKAK